MSDHVYMLISVPPKFGVSQVVGFIKGTSAIHPARVHGENRGTLWARVSGCGVSRIGRRAGREGDAQLHPRSGGGGSAVGANEPLALNGCCSGRLNSGPRERPGLPLCAAHNQRVASTAHPAALSSALLKASGSAGGYLLDRDDRACFTSPVAAPPADAAGARGRPSHNVSSTRALPKTRKASAAWTISGTLKDCYAAPPKVSMSVIGTAHR